MPKNLVEKPVACPLAQSGTAELMCTEVREQIDAKVAEWREEGKAGHDLSSSCASASESCKAPSKLLGVPPFRAFSPGLTGSLCISWTLATIWRCSCRTHLVGAVGGRFRDCCFPAVRVPGGLWGAPFKNRSQAFRIWEQPS